MLIAVSAGRRGVRVITSRRSAVKLAGHVEAAMFARRLGYVHLKDWALGKYCILGEGTKGIDWAAVLASFTAVGFDGWVTTELSWYGDSDADAACHANRTYLRSLGY